MFISACVAFAAALCTSGAYISHKYFPIKDRFTVMNKETKQNKFILDRCASLKHELTYSSLTNGHFQTIWSSLYRGSVEHVLRTDEWGDIKLDYLRNNRTHAVLIVTGLFGTSKSPYISNLVTALAPTFDIYILNFPRNLSVPCTWFDLKELIHESVAHIRATTAYTYLFGVGFSNGGNSFVNYLTMNCDDDDEHCDHNISGINGLITISQAFDGMRSYHVLSTMYEHAIAHEMCKLMNDNSSVFHLEKPLKSTSIIDIEQQTTCQIRRHAQKSVSDVYDECSSYYKFQLLRVPTLVLFANDDPVSNSETIPYHSLITNDNIIFAVSQFGGHIGWSEKDEDHTQLKINNICLEYLTALVEFFNYTENFNYLTATTPTQ